MTRVHRLLPPAAFVLLAASPASAATFPEITAEERALAALPDQPNASAAVLFKKGRFTVIDPNSGRYNPTFVVQVRRKILTEEGKKYGEASLFHSRQVRLQNLEGRTVLPGGKVIPLPKDSIFRRRISKANKQFVTSIAFPSVEVGAILDYQYELRLPSAFLFEPWYFQEEVPTLRSEMVYEIPRELVVSSYLQDPLKVGIQQNTEKLINGWRIQAWGKNLPAVPLEPHGFPYADVASRYMLLATEVQDGMAGAMPLFKSWSTTCDLYAPGYEKALKKDGAAGKKARELAASGGKRERAEALYRFVRDEITTEEAPGVGLAEDTTPDSVLKARRGDYAAKALLLQSMLRAIDVPARLVWAAQRSSGLINMGFATPWWFDFVLVAAEIDGQRVFLDPSDRDLAFGRLAPGFEGMPALVFDKKNPEPVDLPVTSFEQNTRRATVEMDLDAEGRLTGKGSLTLAGHHAWSRLHWGEDAEKTVKAWKEWLDAEYKGFVVSDVRVAEAVDEQKIEVSWALAQREEDVLGDEVTLTPSRPLGPAEQPFPLPAARRVTPILFDFADRDDVELTLRWPEGWEPEALPNDAQALNAAGALQTSVTVDEAARRLTYKRRLEIKQRYVALPQYGIVQSLFTQAEKNDAQALVLVRR
jgi:transglutaminase-like putative cysteine protease